MRTRHHIHSLLAFAFLLLTLPQLALSQTQRPVPYPVLPTPQYTKALDNNTRSLDGNPGANYWANEVDYTIQASLDPETALLEGSAAITYTNNSPDSLGYIILHHRQNLHKEGVVRNRPQKLTGGVQVSDVVVNGTPMKEAGRNEPGYNMNGTLMTVQLPMPLARGESVEISLDWQFRVPEAGAPRMGQDGEIFFLAYWYPQVAMYDDLNGWKADQYMGNGEFYMNFANYDVELTLPAGWIVGATGALQNADMVLSDSSNARLATAYSTRDVTPIFTAEELAAGHSPTRASTDGLAWHFKAEKVRDFAFGTSNKYVWDAAVAISGDIDDDGQADSSMVHGLYRPDKQSWNRSAEFLQFSIEFMSEKFFPYPYPHMTAAEGVVGGGMEFPMMTHIGGNRNDKSLFSVTFHETAHMWFPMVVAQDEKSYTWMDEGLTSFNTAEARAAFWKDDDQWLPEKQSYYRIAGTGREVESMRHGDQYPYGTSARGIASYNKPAVALHALRGLVGEEAFMHAYRTYAARWKWKHPLPFDLFNTFEDVLGQDMDWFWTTMFYETWTLDHAIKNVEETENGVFITLEDKALSPMPLPLRVTYDDNSVEEQVIPVDFWLDGARETTLTFRPGKVKRVEIDPDMFLPDVDRSDNVWQPAEEG